MCSEEDMFEGVEMRRCCLGVAIERAARASIEAARAKLRVVLKVSMRSAARAPARANFFFLLVRENSRVSIACRS